MFLGCGVLAGGWRCWAAVPQECSTPWGLEQLSGSLRGSSLGQPNSEGQPENVGGSFHSLDELVAAFLGCRGSSRALVVLSSYVTGVGHPLGAWAGSRAVGDPRDSSPGQPNSERLSEIFSRLSQACCSFSGLQGVLPGAGSLMQLVH